MTRSAVIAAVRSYLDSAYSGPVAILSETADEVVTPPYAVVRVGSSENIGAPQVEIWDINLLVAVFHDADTTAAETAESQAAAVFATLDDPAALFTASSATLVWSALERIGAEASIQETRWQHVAVFQAIVAPAAED